jgi:DNA-binding GntR family transcriptional regulator
MPWVTAKLDEATVADMIKQIEACLDAAIEEAIPRPEDPKSMDAELKKMRKARTKGHGERPGG